ncbi:MAG: flagellar hook-associated protein FlgL [Lysobacteraceae bacterium]|nr:MAG: flagellar hook-associated protein FlgL [Xanthomonadaceae bacterium]
MTTRIASATFFEQALFQMLRQQKQIAHTQLELSSGRRILTAKDDPINAGIGEAIDRSLAELARWRDNATQVQNRLRLEEETLRSIGLELQRAQELAVQANSAVHTRESLQGMLEELRRIREALIQQANTTDGTGRYLFGGTNDATAPFGVNASGGVDYFGDQRQRRIEIGPDLTVADTDPGSALFQRIRTGNGEFVVRAGATNTGTGVLKTYGFTDRTQWTQEPFTVTFATLPGPPPTTQWTATQDNPPNAVVGSGTYVPGQAIAFSGIQLVLEGDPANGDTVTVAPSTTRDVFASLQALIDAIEMPIGTEPLKAQRLNALFAAAEDLAQAGQHLIDRRASVGSRLALIESTDTQRDGENEVLRTTLSALRDTDYAEAISRLTFQLQTLEATQQSFLRVQELSLFNLLR